MTPLPLELFKIQPFWWDNLSLMPVVMVMLMMILVMMMMMVVMMVVKSLLDNQFL